MSREKPLCPFDLVPSLFMKSIPIRSIHANTAPEAGRFSIRKLQDIMEGRELLHDLHRHDFYFFLFLEKGKGVHEIDFHPFKINGAGFFLLRPGQVHLLSLKAGATGYLMEFDPAFYRPDGEGAVQRLRKVNGRNHLPLDAESVKLLSPLFQRILEECTTKRAAFKDSIRYQLDMLYVELYRICSREGSRGPAPASYSQERFEEFTELLEANCAEHKQVAFYTDKMNLSAYQLNEITKATTGKTVSALVDEHLQLEARRYLLATNNQVKEIADLLGFEDVSYFIRFFKRHTGQSPEAFRKNLK